MPNLFVVCDFSNRNFPTYHVNVWMWTNISKTFHINRIQQSTMLSVIQNTEFIIITISPSPPPPLTQFMRSFMIHCFYFIKFYRNHLSHTHNECTNSATAIIVFNVAYEKYYNIIFARSSRTRNVNLVWRFDASKWWYELNWILTFHLHILHMFVLTNLA